MIGSTTRLNTGVSGWDASDCRFAADEYKTMSHISDLILNNGGMIFGGFVRDSLIRHEAMRKTMMAVDHDQEHPGLTDPTFCPDLKDRFLVPSDLDCMMRANMVSNFIQSMKDHIGLSVIKVFNRKPAQYNPALKALENDPKFGQIRHIRLRATTDTQKLMSILRTCYGNALKVLRDSFDNDCSCNLFSAFSVEIDILTVPDMSNLSDPFLVAPDFECNSWYIPGINKSLERPIFMTVEERIQHYMSRLRLADAVVGDATEMQKVDIYERARSDTLNKVARAINPDATRIEKMQKKGYILVDLPLPEPFEEKTDAEIDDVCVICLEQLQATHVSSRCCSVKMHRDCFDEMMRNGSVRCPVCKIDSNSSQSGSEQENSPSGWDEPTDEQLRGQSVAELMEGVRFNINQIDFRHDDASSDSDYDPENEEQSSESESSQLQNSETEVPQLRTRTIVFFRDVFGSTELLPENNGTAEEIDESDDESEDESLDPADDHSLDADAYFNDDDVF